MARFTLMHFPNNDVCEYWQHKDALNERYDEGNTDIVVNQGHRSNL